VRGADAAVCRFITRCGRGAAAFGSGVRQQLAVGLSELLARLLEDLMAESEFCSPDDFLFHRPDGRPVEPKVFREEILYPAMARAEIPVEKRATGLPLFRHTVGSLLNKKQRI